MSGFFGLSFLASPTKLVENPGIDPGTSRSFFFVGLAAIARGIGTLKTPLMHHFN